MSNNFEIEDIFYSSLASHCNVNSLHFSPDSGCIIVAGFNGIIQVFKPTSSGRVDVSENKYELQNVSINDKEETSREQNKPSHNKEEIVASEFFETESERYIAVGSISPSGSTNFFAQKASRFQVFKLPDHAFENESKENREVHDSATEVFAIDLDEVPSLIKARKHEAESINDDSYARSSGFDLIICESGIRNAVRIVVFHAETKRFDLRVTAEVMPEFSIRDLTTSTILRMDFSSRESDQLPEYHANDEIDDTEKASMKLPQNRLLALGYTDGKILILETDTCSQQVILSVDFKFDSPISVLSFIRSPSDETTVLVGPSLGPADVLELPEGSANLRRTASLPESDGYDCITSACTIELGGKRFQVLGTFAKDLLIYQLSAGDMTESCTQLFESNLIERYSLPAPILSLKSITRNNLTMEIQTNNNKATLAVLTWKGLHVLEINCT